MDNILAGVVFTAFDPPTLQELRGFFTESEWAEMTDHEKLANMKAIDNYRVMVDLDLNSPEPDFMTRARERTEGGQKDERANVGSNVGQREMKADLRGKASNESKQRGSITNRKENRKQRIYNSSHLFHEETSNDDLEKLFTDEEDRRESVRNYSKCSAALLAVNHCLANSPDPKMRQAFQMFKRMQISEENRKVLCLPSSSDCSVDAAARCTSSTQGSANIDFGEDEDRWILCDFCGLEWLDGCQKHKLTIIEDRHVPLVPRRASRALRTLPKELMMYNSQVTGGMGNGIWTRCLIPKGVRFGPYQGRTVETTNHPEYSWQIIKRGKRVHYLDGYLMWYSNWMRYVKMGRHAKESNLVAYQYNGEIYYRSSEEISPFTELVVLPKHILNYPAEELAAITGVPPPWVQGQPSTKETGSKKSGTGGAQSGEACCEQKTIERTKPRNKGDLKKIVQLEPDLEECVKNNSCGNKTNQKEGLEHILAVHNKVKPFSCDKCEYKASSRGNLQKHILAVHNKVKPFSCDECEYKASSRGNLQQHILAVHNKVKPFSCDECEYKASSRGNLQQHILAVHNKVKPFSCDKCEYKASSRGTIQQHILAVHNKVKPFSCDKCEYKTISRGHLQQHILAVHNKVKPFSCDKCEYKASSRGTIQQHILAVHNKVKPL